MKKLLIVLLFLILVSACSGPTNIYIVDHKCKDSVINKSDSVHEVDVAIVSEDGTISKYIYKDVDR